MNERWTPTLRVTEEPRGRCRLSMAGCAHGYGDTLQEAADDLVRTVVRLAQMVRDGAAVGASTEAPRVDPHLLQYMYELAQLAAEGGDVRQHLFAPG